MKLSAYRCLKAARTEASPDGAVAPDQNLSCLNVIGEGMLAFEGHSLDTEQKGQDASFPKCQSDTTKQKQNLSRPSVIIKLSKGGQWFLS